LRKADFRGSSGACSNRGRADHALTDAAKRNGQFEAVGRRVPPLPRNITLKHLLRIACIPPCRPGSRLCLLIATAIACAGTMDPARAQVTETVLDNFAGGTDGYSPYSPVLVASGRSGAASALYGTAYYGGTHTYGTVFKLTPPKAKNAAWKSTALWDFSYTPDGRGPLDGLLSRKSHISSKTPLYGAATSGARGYGTIYSLTGHTLTTLYTFTGGSDGAYPGVVVADKSGALYATAYSNGGSSFCGTAVQLTPPPPGQSTWAEKTIWNFTGGTDSCNPGGLTPASGGAFYGTAEAGGRFGRGTAFQLTPPAQGQTAWTEQILWSFGKGTDGSLPDATLIAAKDGTLYGVTENGGSSTACQGGCGTVFSLQPPKHGRTAWTEQVLWSFSGSDGYDPIGALLLDATGALYGTTAQGGPSGGGTAFKLAPPAQGQSAWTETMLFAFVYQGTTGYSANGALAADNAGTLYGTASLGGTGTGCPNNPSCGVVFSLTGTGFVPQ
jgi:uncharacterized repeat protein (TIGR03803 family)